MAEEGFSLAQRSAWARPSRSTDSQKGIAMLKLTLAALLAISPSLVVAVEPSTHALQRIGHAGYAFPSAANTQGAYGAYFKTKLVLTNPTLSELTIDIYLATPAGSLRAWNTKIAAATTLQWDNFLEGLGGYYGGAGFLLIERTQSKAFYASAEVYAENANGKFTTPLVGMSTADSVVNTAKGDTGWSMVQGLQVNSSNRANFGCANFSNYTARVQADLYNETSSGVGNPTKRVTVDLPAWGWAQQSVPFSGEQINILFSVVSGGTTDWTFCYGVNVNNQSKDGTLRPAYWGPLQY